MTMSVPIDIAANRTRATTAKITPGLANRVARQPPSNAIPVRMTPIVATAAPTAWMPRQALAPDDDREDDGQPAIRRDHPADDRDRSDAEAREVARYAPAPTRPTERRDRRSRPDRSGATCRVTRARSEIERGTDELHPGRDARLPTRRLASAEKMSSVPQAGRRRVR